MKIDDIISERSLLKHPFYVMWSDGDLKLDALAGYSKEYFQLVKAVPEFMSNVIEKAPTQFVEELRSNQQEEIDHIQPWVKFAGALGVDELYEYGGLPKTRQAIQNMSDLMGTFEEGACAMYAFEKEIPKISQIKMEGLAEFYGITDAEAIEYFKLHTEADIRHAASWEKMMSGDHTDTAILSLDAQNLLLDACYEAYCV